MFIIFTLKKAQAWVPMVLLLLSFLICPHSSYPHGPEDEDPTEAEGDSEESQQLAPNEDNDVEEEETLEEDAEDVENDTKKPCIPEGSDCTDTADCCPGIVTGWTVKCRLSKRAKAKDPKQCLNTEGY